jgi:TonB family protein
MLLLMGGLIYWKLSGDEETTSPPPPPVATTTAPKVLDEPPPPPPPPDEPEVDAGAPKQTKRSGVASTGGGGCGGPCNGQASATLKAQLGAKASQARACYERALRQNAHLQGRMRLGVRIGPTGNVCSASITSSELGDPGVASCVVQIFRSSSFAAPQGGCVDAEVPMRFEPKT